MRNREKHLRSEAGDGSQATLLETYLDILTLILIGATGLLLVDLL